jgi:hypothetical protein
MNHWAKAYMPLAGDRPPPRKPASIAALLLPRRNSDRARRSSSHDGPFSFPALLLALNRSIPLSGADTYIFPDSHYIGGD